MPSTIRDLVAQFVSELESMVAKNVEARVREFVDKAFPGRAGTRARAAVASGAGATKAAKAKPGPRKPVSAARKRAMKVQGQYLGLLKGLTGPDREKVTALAKSEGVPAAIALAKKLKK